MDFTADTILPRVNHTLKDTKETRRKIYKGKLTFWTKKRMAFGVKWMWKTNHLGVGHHLQHLR